jgi:hypothetical protein
MVLKALTLCGGANPIQAFDLGAGVGRHTFYGSGPGCRVKVIAVDVIPSVAHLKANVLRQVSRTW